MAAVVIAIAAPYLAPIALGALGIAATTTAVAIATAVIGLTLSVGLSLAFRALGVGAPSAKSAVGPPVVFRQSIANSFIVYGKRRVGGLLVFYHARESGGDHYRYFVVAVAGHQCSGVVDWMLNDDTVTVDGSGMVTSGKYANAAWLWFVRGTGSDAANATFVSETGGKWTTAHKGLGIAKIYAKFKLTDDVVEAGMPNITAIIEGKDDIADPRDDSIGYTRNAALIFYDWMKIAREEGGFGAYDDEIPDAAWISAQANVCDETVNGAMRYAIDAVITTGAAPNEIRDTLVVNQAGTYTYSEGKHLMRPGYWVPVSETLSEDDLAGPVQVSPFMPADAAANEVQGTYISPGANYQGAPFATVSVAGADVRQVDLDLAYVTSHDQAYRVARIMLNRAQKEKTVVWPMNIAGLKAKTMDTVQVDSARYGLSNYAWTVTNWGLSADWGVVLSLREESEDIYDAPAAAVPVSPPTVTQPTAPVQPTSDLTTLIRDSGCDGSLKFACDSSGNITIADHNRIYADKTVAVDGTPGTAADGTGGTPLATGAASGNYVLVFYDDPARAGGTVTYQWLEIAPGGDDSSAYATAAHPYRHFVLIALVPGTGSTSGGSSPGSGGGGASGGGGVYAALN